MTHTLPVGPSFRLAAIPKLGQDFRWHKLDDGRYSAVLTGNLIHVWQEGRVLKYKSHSGSNLNDLLSCYFRLRDPIDKIYHSISALDDQDDQIAKLVEKYHPGLRLLKQDPWECMVAYICSTNNNVNRISAIVEKLAKELGERIELCGDVRYTFPTCKQVLAAGIERLEKLKLGLDRHSKIFAAAKRVCGCELNLYKLAQPNVPYDEAKRQLMECYGIGNKVADCIALFALDKMEAFPVDRNMGERWPICTTIVPHCRTTPMEDYRQAVQRHSELGAESVSASTPAMPINSYSTSKDGAAIPACSDYASGHSKHAGL